MTLYFYTTIAVGGNTMMHNMIEDKLVEINGEEFRIQPFPAFKGLVILKKLTKIVGPSMTSLLSNNDGEAQDVDLSNMDKAVSLLVEHFDGDGVESLIKELIASVTKDGKALSFNLEFMTDYGKLLKLVMEVVKFNYSSVFQLGGLLQE